VGDESPDVEDFAPLVAAFKVTQSLLDQKLISAGHDRSDGGLATCLLEVYRVYTLLLSLLLPLPLCVLVCCISYSTFIMAVVAEAQAQHLLQFLYEAGTVAWTRRHFTALCISTALSVLSQYYDRQSG
jgi:phosphoribosylformylglycinamidine (FGAM) synthase-like enzyme